MIADIYSRIKDSKELLESFVIEPIAVQTWLVIFKLTLVLFFLNSKYHSQENTGNKAVKSPWNTTDGYKWEFIKIEPKFSLFDNRFVHLINCFEYIKFCLFI